MKIAMISEDAGPHVAELSAAMARRRHDVTLYTRGDAADSTEQARTPRGYTVARVPAAPSAKLSEDDVLNHIGVLAQWLDGVWSRERPDVAHAHSWISGIATQLSARATHLPTMQSFYGLGVVERRHRGERDAGPSARMKLEKLVTRHATWIAATCTDEVTEVTRLGRSRTTISVVPCGVDTEKFSMAGPTASRGAMNRIVAAGELVPHNGFDTIIEALPGIVDAKFVIVGGPDAADVAADPEARRLRALATALGVSDRVTFTGAVAHDDMPALLRPADLLTCTPLYEPVGAVALQAMACGVPVVGSAVGAFRDIVIHDVTGRLVAPRRPRECAEAVSAILRDSFLRRSLGLAGRDRACARYSWDRVAEDAERIYDRLITAPAPRLQERV